MGTILNAVDDDAATQMGPLDATYDVITGGIKHAQLLGLFHQTNGGESPRGQRELESNGALMTSMTWSAEQYGKRIVNMLGYLHKQGVEVNKHFSFQVEVPENGNNWYRIAVSWKGEELPLHLADTEITSFVSVPAVVSNGATTGYETKESDDDWIEIVQEANGMEAVAMKEFVPAQPVSSLESPESALVSSTALSSNAVVSETSNEKPRTLLNEKSAYLWLAIDLAVNVRLLQLVEHEYADDNPEVTRCVDRFVKKFEKEPTYLQKDKIQNVLKMITVSDEKTLQDLVIESARSHLN
ncbi:MAG: hypothetical protein ACPGUD_14110 [Parashewanella sp.]